MTENEGYLLLALPLIPLGSAILLMLIPSRERTVIRGVTGAASLAMFLISVYVFFAFDYKGEQFQGVLAWPWIENAGFLGENGIQLKVGIDGIAAPMILLTGIVIMSGTWVSWKVETRSKDFFILLFVLVAGVYGTFVALDLFFWFLLYRDRGAADVPADRRLGLRAARVRRDEADDDARCRLDPDLHRDLRHLHRGRPRHLRHALAL